jgi:cell division protein FtsW
MGLIGCVVVAAIDYRRLKKFSVPLLILTVILLGLVLEKHIGISVKGGRRWLAIPHLGRFQPSEIAKLALIIFMAHYCESYQRRMGEFVRGLVIPVAVILPVIALIFVEPDRGVAILMTAVCGIMLFIAGARIRYAVVPVLLGAAFLYHSLTHDAMRMHRILAWLHPEDAKDGVGYQAYQALIALGSGGLRGLGLGDSRQKLGFVPEHHTDFILSIIGEELGLIATIAVVATFVVLIVCSTIIARRASDTFGMMLASGVTFLIGLQALINVGVITSTLPNKGMPLPFISYGGSNLLIMLLSVGLLISVSRYSSEPAKNGSNPFDVDSGGLEHA